MAEDIVDPLHRVADKCAALEKEMAQLFINEENASIVKIAVGIAQLAKIMRALCEYLT
jgi:hypothetical protein